MPKKIILVRHGVTEYNVSKRMQGWIDVPLLPEGLSQAEKVAKRLRGEQIDFIYSSDQKRAHATAVRIAKEHNLVPKKRKALRERRMGIFEGWHWEDVGDPRNVLWKERELAHKNGNYDWKSENEESMVEHFTRVKKYITKLETLHDNHKIVIVSHGATLNRILEAYGLRRMQDEYISFGNTSVTIITKKPSGYELELLNDTTHL